MKYFRWLGWFLFIISCVCEGYFFLVDYKKPISMGNQVDATKITYILEKEHPNKKIKNIHILNILFRFSFYQMQYTNFFIRKNGGSRCLI